MLARKRHPLGKRQSVLIRRLLITVFFALTVCEAVAGTLSATHIYSAAGLKCALNERWQHLYSTKDADAIQKIQNALECCGLHSTVDRAWPFKDKWHADDTCRTLFGRQKSCFEDWRNEERKAATLMMIVPIVVLFWKVCRPLSPWSRTLR